MVLFRYFMIFAAKKGVLALWIWNNHDMVPCNWLISKRKNTEITLRWQQKSHRNRNRSNEFAGHFRREFFEKNRYERSDQKNPFRHSGFFGHFGTRMSHRKICSKRFVMRFANGTQICINHQIRYGNRIFNRFAQITSGSSLKIVSSSLSRRIQSHGMAKTKEKKSENAIGNPIGQPVQQDCGISIEPLATWKLVWICLIREL